MTGNASHPVHRMYVKCINLLFNFFDYPAEQKRAQRKFYAAKKKNCIFLFRVCVCLIEHSPKEYTQNGETFLPIFTSYMPINSGSFAMRHSLRQHGGGCVWMLSRNV